ncbi:MAG: oxygenase MpaB family protein [Actinomycetes bacterium]
MALTLPNPRATLAKAVMHRVAGNRFQDVHNRIWDTPGERWFAPEDAIWRVHADTAMFVGGIRALLLEALHPVAMLAVSEHSGVRSDPWGRLQRTSTFLATTTYGAAADAERAVSVVRAIHGRIRGVTPDGRDYRADDPDLLLWIHAAGTESFLVGHQHFGQVPLDAAEADAFVRQSGDIARRLGVTDPPATVAELTAVLEGYRPVLTGSAPAREATDLLLHDPPLGYPARLGYRVLAAGAVSTLPHWARAMLRLPTLPVTDRTVVRPLARSAVVTLRWALSGL